jgi:hypothetical protein
MSAPLELAGGTVVHVAPPPLPTLTATPPANTPAVVVPVAGPPGPQGPPGDSSTALGRTETVSAPTYLAQIQHGLSFRPGVHCLDTAGNGVHPATVTHPQPGITEVGFGAPFTGTIDLS